MAQLTPAAPRLRSSDGTFSKAGELTSNLIRKAYGYLRRPTVFDRRGRVVEFGRPPFAQMSLTTTKRVMQDFRGSVPNSASLRLPGSITESQARLSGDEGWYETLQNGRREVAATGGTMKIPAATRIAMVGRTPEDLPRLNTSPSAIGLHEWGHLADANNLVHDERIYRARQRAILGHDEKAFRQGRPTLVTSRAADDARRQLVLGRERRANVEVANRVAKYGSPADVLSWKRTANAQMSEGYRKRFLRAVAEDLSGKIDPMTGMHAKLTGSALHGDFRKYVRQALKTRPYLQAKNVNLSRRLLKAAVIEFQTR